MGCAHGDAKPIALPFEPPDPRTWLRKRWNMDVRTGQINGLRNGPHTGRRNGRINRPDKPVEFKSYSMGNSMPHCANESKKGGGGANHTIDFNMKIMMI